MADAKAREKEDEVRLCQAEYERKMKLQEERIMFRQSKQEEREVYEVKRKAMIDKETLERKVEEMKEEIDYFQEKVAKIEAENKGLRVGNDASKRIKMLEDDNA